MDSVEDIKRALSNPALTPSYRQVLEKRLRDLESKPGQPVEAPKPPQCEPKPQAYAGVSSMSAEEIVRYYSTGSWYRLDTPISGLQALQHLYSMFGILGKDRATVARVAEAVRQMGGDLPEMQHIDISDLLKKD